MITSFQNIAIRNALKVYCLSMQKFSTKYECDPFEMSATAQVKNSLPHNLTMGSDTVRDDVTHLYEKGDRLAKVAFKRLLKGIMKYCKAWNCEESDIFIKIYFENERPVLLVTGRTDDQVIKEVF